MAIEESSTPAPAMPSSLRSADSIGGGDSVAFDEDDIPF